MRQITLGFAFLLVAAAAFAQTPEVRISAFPFYGSVSGGDITTLTIDGVTCHDFRQNFRVRFGDAPAPSAFATATGCRTIQVVTPPHGPGTVDVSVTINDVAYTTPRVFTFTGNGEIPLSSNYQQILIPLPIPPAGTVSPGANGAQWVTDAYVHNGTTSHVELFNNLDVCRVIVCHNTDPYPGFEPGTHPLPAMDRPSFWYVQKTRAKDMTFSIQVYDRARGHENSGTEIPVVRESDYRRDELYLPRVPITSAGRTSLRIYLALGEPSATRPVEVYLYRADDPPGADPVAWKPIFNVTPEVNGLFKRAPAYVFLGDLRSDFPYLGDGVYRVRVTLADANFWAMASVANDTTNLVTVFSPQ